MSPALLDETLALRARYDEEPSHSDHVAGLSRQLFDELRAWHRLDTSARDLLHCAALLHDIGWSQTADGTGHHKHSARLILEHPWRHLRPPEVAVVAQIARYHRKSTPRPDHRDFQALPAIARRRVMILGGLLRVGDALDRSHTARVDRLVAEIAAGLLIIRVQAKGCWDAERTMFETKRDMLEMAAERAVRCAAL